MRVPVSIGSDHIPQHARDLKKEEGPGAIFVLWAKMFLAAARFWKLLGAGVFGFLGVIVHEKRDFR
jgi:hypothetical protein